MLKPFRIGAVSALCMKILLLQILYHKNIEKIGKLHIIYLYATIAQLAECILGKDEVTGPTPVGGSKMNI